MRTLISMVVAFSLALMFPYALNADATGGGEPRAAQQAQPSGDATVPLEALSDSEVLDHQGNRLGTVQELMIDPQEGKIVRAEIALRGEGVLRMFGRDHISVPWDEVTVQQREGELVLALDQQAIERAPERADRAEGETTPERPVTR